MRGPMVAAICLLTPSVFMKGHFSQKSRNSCNASAARTVPALLSKSPLICVIDCCHWVTASCVMGLVEAFSGNNARVRMKVKQSHEARQRGAASASKAGHLVKLASKSAACELKHASLRSL